MASMKFKRFLDVQVLEQINRKLLAEFLWRFKKELAERKIEIPSADLDDYQYYKVFIDLLTQQPDELPESMIDALYVIDEMATGEGLARLERVAQEHGIALDFQDKDKQRRSPADVALQVWLVKPSVLNKLCNDLNKVRSLTFECYGSKSRVNRGAVFERPKDEAIEVLKMGLDDWFSEHDRRSRTVQVVPRLKGGEWYFLIRHEDMFLRMAEVDKQEIGLLPYCPAMDDVVVFSPMYDELGIRAKTKEERDLYRRKFGACLRGDEDYFSERMIYTLEPLRERGVDALDTRVEGIDRIILREIEVVLGGEFHEVSIHKADDIFETAKYKGTDVIPAKGVLRRAEFDFYFQGEDEPCNVHIYIPNSLKVGERNSDPLVMEWLELQGFRCSSQPKTVIKK